MKFLIKALLAATALLPVATAASAQDAPRERQWQREGRGERQERGDRGAWRQRSEQPGRVMADRSRRGEVRADTGVQTRGGWNRGDAQVRADAGSRFRPAPPEVEQRRDRRADRGVPPGFRDYGRSTGDWDRQRAQRDDRVRNDRRFAGNNWDRGNDRRFAGNDWNRGNDRRFDNRQGWNGQDWDRQSWNRTWRNDRRYDWGGYRAGNRGAYRLPRYYAPPGWGYGYRRFSVGVTLDRGLWGENYWIDDPYSYRLPDAYGPYRWVRYYNDALLVDVRYGQVVDVVHDIFW